MSSALRMPAPAAPRMVLCPKHMYLTVIIGSFRILPTTTLMPLPSSLSISGLRSVRFLPYHDWVFWSGRKLQFLRFALKPREGFFNLIQRGILVKLDEDGFQMPVLNVDSVATRAENEIGVAYSCCRRKSPVASGLRTPFSPLPWK